MLPIRLALLALLIASSTLLHVTPILLVSLLKAVLPFRRLQSAANPRTTGSA